MLDIDLLHEKANETGVNPARLAFEVGAPLLNEVWRKPRIADDRIMEAVGVDLIDDADGKSDVIGNVAENIADIVKFPRSTAYLTAIGVLSAAMTERFRIKYNGELCTSLYIVTAQPPSTGKSGVINLLTAPCHAAYNAKIERIKPHRNTLERKIDKLKRKIAREKCERTAEDMDRELIELEEKLEHIPRYNWCTNDPTAEGCERVLSHQNGFFNVISDETSAVRVMLGQVYGNGSKTNNGVFLRAWDNGYHSVARQSRDGYNGRVRGSFVVLAQSASIDAILTAGADGEGISERVLMFHEKNLLGTRNHLEYEKLNKAHYEEYEALIQYCIGDSASTLDITLSNEAINDIRRIKNELEGLMSDGERYSHPLLRGMVGKADKQIVKIASVFCLARTFKTQAHQISANDIFRARCVFERLLMLVVNITDDRKITGNNAQLEKLREYFQKLSHEQKLEIEFAKLRDHLRQLKAFKGIPLFSEKLKREYLPELETDDYIVFDEANGMVYVNPKI